MNSTCMCRAHAVLSLALQIISSTSAMLHTPSRIISTRSEHIPFYPGDIVGLGGMERDTTLPAELPTDGLVVSATVKGLGTLATRVKRAVEQVSAAT